MDNINWEGVQLGSVNPEDVLVDILALDLDDFYFKAGQDGEDVWLAVTPKKFTPDPENDGWFDDHIDAYVGHIFENIGIEAEEVIESGYVVVNLTLEELKAKLGTV